MRAALESQTVTDYVKEMATRQQWRGRIPAVNPTLTTDQAQEIVDTFQTLWRQHDQQGNKLGAAKTKQAQAIFAITISAGRRGIVARHAHTSTVAACERNSDQILLLGVPKDKGGVSFDLEKNPAQLMIRPSTMIGEPVKLVDECAQRINEQAGYPLIGPPRQTPGRLSSGLLFPRFGEHSKHEIKGEFIGQPNTAEPVRAGALTKMMSKAMQHTPSAIIDDGARAFSIHGSRNIQAQAMMAPAQSLKTINEKLNWAPKSKTALRYARARQFAAMRAQPQSARQPQIDQQSLGELRSRDLAPRF